MDKLLNFALRRKPVAVTHQTSRSSRRTFSAGAAFVLFVMAGCAPKEHEVRDASTGAVTVDPNYGAGKKP